MTHRQAKQLAADVYKRTGNLACAVRVTRDDYVVHVALQPAITLTVSSYADLERAGLLGPVSS